MTVSLELEDLRVY